MWRTIFILGAFGVSNIWASSDCSPTSLSTALSKCNPVSDNSREEDDMVTEKICDRLDCIIQCRRDVIGDCQNRDTYHQELAVLDTEMWTIFTRLSCAHRQWMKFIPECVENRICAEIDNPDNITMDMNGLCRFYAQERECITNSISPHGSCTADVARLKEDIKKVFASNSKCDNADIKPLYKKYGGDVKCAQVNSSMLVTSKAYSTPENSPILACCEMTQGAATNDGSSSTVRLSSALYVVNLMLLYCCVNVLQRQFS